MIQFIVGPIQYDTGESMSKKDENTIKEMLKWKRMI